MNIYISKSPLTVKPYIFPLSKKEVYSFEGLCYLLQGDWFEGVVCLETEHMLQFIQNQLQLPNVSQEVGNLLAKKSYVQVFTMLFSYCQIKNPNYDDFMVQIKSWDLESEPEQLKKIADIFYENDQLSLALSYYSKAKVLGNTYKIENNMGLVHMKLRNYHLADEAFRRALALNACDEIYHNLIQLLKQQGRLDEALALIYTLVATSQSALLLYEAGDISLRKRLYNQALIYFLKSYELEENPETIYQVIQTKIEAKQLQSAMEQVESMKDSGLEAYFILKAKIFERAKHLDAAIETVEEGISALGDSKAFYIALARLFRLNQQIIKAIQAVTWLTRAGYMDDEIVYEMALIAKQAGKYADYYEKIERLIVVWKQEARFSLSY